MMELIFLGLETLSKILANPIFGLGGDGARAGALVGLFAKYGRKGQEAYAELKAFVDEIEEILESGARMDVARWDEITDRRHADFERIRAS